MKWPVEIWSPPTWLLMHSWVSVSVTLGSARSSGRVSVRGLADEAGQTEPPAGRRDVRIGEVLGHDVELRGRRQRGHERAAAAAPGRQRLGPGGDARHPDDEQPEQAGAEAERSPAARVEAGPRPRREQALEEQAVDRERQRRRRRFEQPVSDPEDAGAGEGEDRTVEHEPGDQRGDQTAGGHPGRERTGRPAQRREHDDEQQQQPDLLGDLAPVLQAVDQEAEDGAGQMREQRRLQKVRDRDRAEHRRDDLHRCQGGDRGDGAGHDPAPHAPLHHTLQITAAL